MTDPSHPRAQGAAQPTGCIAMQRNGRRRGLPVRASRPDAACPQQPIGP